MFGAPFPGSNFVIPTFLAHQESATAAASFTFTGLNFGAASPDRYLVACICWEGSPAKTLTSCTIGGVAASIICQVNGGSTSVNSSAICIALVPTGTSGNVVANFSGSAGETGCSLYSVSGIPAGTASSSATSAANAPTATINVPGGGAVIAVANAIGPSGAPTATWTGLTKDVDAVIGSPRTYSSASAMFSAANPSLSVTCTFSSTNGSSGCFAVFSP